MQENQPACTCTILDLGHMGSDNRYRFQLYILKLLRTNSMSLKTIYKRPIKPQEKKTICTRALGAVASRAQLGYIHIRVVDTNSGYIDQNL